jgi:hypothetical protein
MKTFTDRLQTLAKQAERDPLGTWAQFAALPAEATSAQDILTLGALGAQIAGTALGRFDEAAAFVTGLRAHPAVQQAPEVLRSLWRAEGVMRRCAGQDDGVARGHGIAGADDACRYAGVVAQTLTARGRLAEALPFLQEAAMAAQRLSANDPVVAQTALVAQNIARIAATHAHQAHDLLQAAGHAAVASDGRSADWHRRHLALFTRTRVLLVIGRPGEALRGLHELMDLEDQNNAGAFERFHTAALACRAYQARGDAAQAGRTLEACRDFATRASSHDLSTEIAALEQMLAE